jgi:thioesterase domain-containing protein
MSVNPRVRDSAETQRWRARLTALWRDGIPLAEAMGVSVRGLDEDGLVLAAPLAPNSNHMGTAFGGAMLALATLAGWGVTLIAAGEDFGGSVVIRSGSMDFLTPLSGELLACCPHPGADALEAFRRRIARGRHARLDLPVTIGRDGTLAARYLGVFVAT